MKTLGILKLFIALIMLEKFVVKFKRINEETHVQTLKINCSIEEAPCAVI
jgi:hypothetical protein